MSDPMMFHPATLLPQAFGHTKAEAWSSIGGPKKGLFAKEVPFGLAEYIREKRHAKFCRPNQY